MDFFKEAILSKELCLSAAAVAVGIVCWRIIKRAAKNYIRKNDLSGRKTTHMSYVIAVVKYAIIAVLVTTILQIYGANVSSIVAGLGIVGIVVGFALQDILKDLIMGTNIVVDDFFSVGDVVKYDGIIGKVIYFNIKVTKIKSMTTGGVLTISNRNISQIERQADYIELCVPMSYDVDLHKSREVCGQICKRAAENEMIDRCEFLGTDEFCDSAVNYKLRAYGKPENCYGMKRAMLGTIQDVLTENGLSIPYNCLDICCKKENCAEK